MMFAKCPRCDLNYITASERYCKVCMREMKGDNAQDEIEMCSVCSENPALPGRDICLFCLKEMSNQTGGGAAGHDSSSDGEETVDPRSITSMDDVSSMDEIPEVDNDIPAGEFEQMAGEMSSLESMREEEADDDDDEDEDEI